MSSEEEVSKKPRDYQEDPAENFGPQMHLDLKVLDEEVIKDSLQSMSGQGIITAYNRTCANFYHYLIFQNPQNSDQYSPEFNEWNKLKTIIEEEIYKDFIAHTHEIQKNKNTPTPTIKYFANLYATNIHFQSLLKAKLNPEKDSPILVALEEIHFKNIKKESPETTESIQYPNQKIQQQQSLQNSGISDTPRRTKTIVDSMRLIFGGSLFSRAHKATETTSSHTTGETNVSEAWTHNGNGGFQPSSTKSKGKGPR
ncbi:MAG: hypothetical protein SFT91_01955 [Rickettsiaceae bacterium]|nr:hypothetical protein [Rickettsiaceae bacterium]